MKYNLIISNGPFAGEKFLLKDGVNLIGRSAVDSGSEPEVNLEVFDVDAKVSRRHALLSVVGDSFEFEDLASLNGSYNMKGEPFTPGVKYKIDAGEFILIGNVVLQLVAL